MMAGKRSAIGERAICLPGLCWDVHVKQFEKPIGAIVQMSPIMSVPGQDGAVLLFVFMAWTGNFERFEPSNRAKTCVDATWNASIDGSSAT